MQHITSNINYHIAQHQTPYTEGVPKGRCTRRYLCSFGWHYTRMCIRGMAVSLQLGWLM